MPVKPLPPCRYPGCSNLQDPHGHGYCKEHVKDYRRQDKAQRGSSRERGYTKRYEKARRWVLTHNPLCVVCKAEGRLTAATMTHHIKHLANGGSNSANNLLAVCDDCHSRLHSKDGDRLLQKLGLTKNGASRS